MPSVWLQFCESYREQFSIIIMHQIVKACSYEQMRDIDISPLLIGTELSLSAHQHSLTEMCWLQNSRITS
jgi:hypothetical protein